MGCHSSRGRERRVHMCLYSLNLFFCGNYPFFNLHEEKTTLISCEDVPTFRWNGISNT